MFKYLNWKQWLLCQVAALGAGWLAYSATENAWVGGGVAVGVIVGITFFWAGRAPARAAAAAAARRRSGAKVVEPPAPPTRQQRRAMQRSEKKRIR